MSTVPLLFVDSFGPDVKPPKSDSPEVSEYSRFACLQLVIYLLTEVDPLMNIHIL